MQETTLQIDLEKLLAPISVESPAGEYLRYEGTYDRIQEARREDDDTLPQGIWQTKLKKADWSEVSQLCLEALETRSKDLQLAVWLLEAWVYEYGFIGIREGVKLLVGLCESFWDTLYPEIEGQEIQYRIAPLQWMNDKLPIKIKNIVITAPKSPDGIAYCLADWEKALHLEAQAERDASVLKAAQAEGRVTRARFQGSVMLSPKLFYVKLAKELKTITENLTILERLLSQKCGQRSPSLAQIKNTLTSVQRLVSKVLSERATEEVVETDAPEASAISKENAEVTEASVETTGVPSKGIRSRSEAYVLLSEAAEYLLRTEPHSPTPYLVKRAVSWGSKSLGELLLEIVNNKTDLTEIYTLLGIKEMEDPNKKKK